MTREEYALHLKINPVYVVTFIKSGLTHRIRAKSEAAAISKIARKHGHDKSAYRAYQF